MGYFQRNWAPSTCVCLEKYLRNLRLENILLFVSVVITAVKRWSSARGFTDVSFPVEVLGIGGMRVERAPKSDNIVVLDRHHSPGTIRGLLPAEKRMLPRWPTLCFPLWKVNDFFFFWQGNFFFLIGKPDEAAYYSVIKAQEVPFPSQDGISGMCVFCLPNDMITTLPDATLLHWIRDVISYSLQVQYEASLLSFWGKNSVCDYHACRYIETYYKNLLLPSKTSFLSGLLPGSMKFKSGVS